MVHTEIGGSSALSVFKDDQGIGHLSNVVAGVEIDSSHIKFQGLFCSINCFCRHLFTWPFLCGYVCGSKECKISHIAILNHMVFTLCVVTMALDLKTVFLFWKFARL